MDTPLSEFQFGVQFNPEGASPFLPLIDTPLWIVALIQYSHKVGFQWPTRMIISDMEGCTLACEYLSPDGSMSVPPVADWEIILQPGSTRGLIRGKLLVATADLPSKTQGRG